MSTFKLLINLPGPLRAAIRLLPLGGGADFLLGCLRCFRRFGRRRLRLSERAAARSVGRHARSWGALPRRTSAANSLTSSTTFAAEPVDQTLHSHG
jgi:hypothetical protein